MCAEDIYDKWGDNMINLDVVTIQDCLELYMKDIRVILNDGKVIDFGEGKWDYVGFNG